MTGFGKPAAHMALPTTGIENVQGRALMQLSKAFLQQGKTNTAFVRLIDIAAETAGERVETRGG